MRGVSGAGPRGDSDGHWAAPQGGARKQGWGYGAGRRGSGTMRAGPHARGVAMQGRATGQGQGEGPRGAAQGGGNSPGFSRSH